MKKGKSPALIGLCGRSGSGKGTVASFFGEYGVPSVDTDAVWRSLTGPSGDGGKVGECVAAVAEVFGEGAVLSDGSLNREYVASLVFSADGAEKRELLNRTSHPFILKETERLAAEFKEKGFCAVIIDAPLLFESGIDKKCDFIIATDAPDNVLIDRIVVRDGVSRERASERIASQKRPDELPVDMVIDTDRPLSSIREDVRGIAEFIKEKFS